MRLVVLRSAGGVDNRCAVQGRSERGLGLADEKKRGFWNRLSSGEEGDPLPTYFLRSVTSK